MAERRKISTTVSARTYAYLQSLIERGRARNLAEALDASMGGLLRAENRARLARDTAAYFESMPREVAEEERRMETALAASSGEVDFDAW
ncbi:MAG: hypothetical protein ACE145_05590 [Terriglobia bacterium]